MMLQFCSSYFQDLWLRLQWDLIFDRWRHDLVGGLDGDEKGVTEAIQTKIYLDKKKNPNPISTYHGLNSDFATNNNA